MAEGYRPATLEDFQNAQAPPDTGTPGGYRPATLQDFQNAQTQQPQLPPAEGPIMSAIREGAHAIIPTAAGAVTGVLGAAASPEIGGLGAIPAAIAGAGAADYAQEKLLNAMGFNDSAQRAANAAANPITTDVAAVAPALATFNVGAAGETLGARLASRALGAGMVGGINIGIQKATTGEIDPTQALVAASAGAIAPRTRPWVEGVAGRGLPAVNAARGALGLPEATGAGAAAENVPPTTPGAPGPAPATTTRADGNVNAETADAAEAARVTNTPRATPMGPGASVGHEPLPTSNPATVGSGVVDEVGATINVGRSGTDGKKVPVTAGAPEAGQVDTQSSTPIEMTQMGQQGADIDVAIRGQIGAQDSVQPSETPTVQQTAHSLAPTVEPDIQAATRPETITGAATKIGDKIYRAPVHILARDQAAKELNVPIRTLMNKGDAVDGFLTSEGRFVDRYEAAKIAMNNKQIPNIGEGELHSSAVANDIDKDLTVSPRRPAFYRPPGLPPVEPYNGPQPHGANPMSVKVQEPGVPEPQAPARDWMAEREARALAAEDAAKAQITAPTPESQTPYGQLKKRASLEIARVNEAAAKAQTPGGYRSATVEDFNASKPKAHPLSAGAAPTPDFTSAQPATPAQQAVFSAKLAGLGNSLKQTFGDNWFRQAFSPQSISENTKLMDSIMAQEQGQRGARATRVDEMLNRFNDHLNSAPAADRQAFVENNGQVPRANLLSNYGRMSSAVDNAYQKLFTRYDPNNNFANWLPALFKDTEGAKNFAIDFKDNNTRPATVGDYARAGFQLRPDLARADGSPDLGKLNTNLNMMRDKFIEGKKIADAAITEGIVHQQQSPGDVRLNDVNKGGAPIYAPEEIANVWNKYFDPGIADKVMANLYKGALHLKNALNAIQLAFGGYHLSAMAIEAMTHDMVTAIQRSNKVPVAETLKKVAGAPLAPYRLAAHSGKTMLTAITQPSKITDPNIKAAVQNLINGGGLVKRTYGQGITPELDVSNSGSIMQNWWKSWPRAAEQMKIELESTQGRVASAKGVTGKSAQAAKEVVNGLGEGIHAAMGPLFNTYIPLLKNGAMLEQMVQYRADNPGLSEKAYDAMGRKFVKGTDDRFGELNQSTLYWNNTLKRAANIMMISPGWNVGNVRQIIGGLGAGVRNPAAMFSSHPDFDPRIAYTLGYAVVAAGIGGLYQFLKTGKPPEEAKDLFYPQTGGTAAGSQMPERAIPPGYQKDIQEWLHILMGNEGALPNTKTAAYNKLSLLPRSVLDTISNKDWGDHPIYNPNHPLGSKLKEYLQYVAGNMMPIAAKQISETRPGTNIGPVERLAGLRPAAAYIQKPDVVNQASQKANDRAWKYKEAFDRKMAQ